MKFLALFSLCLAGSVASQLLPLNSFKGGNVNNPLTATAPYGIFVSAYSDATSALQQIFVVTPDGTQKSLYDLKKNKDASGLLYTYLIQDSAYLTTTLSTNDLGRLNGVIFLGTTAQINNKNFRVYDLSASIMFPQSTVNDMTIVILNTDRGVSQSSVISNWKQDANTQVYIYAGVPTDNLETKNYQIFSNPMVSDYGSPFFENVEKFTISLNAFYMKTSKGMAGFRIERGSWSIDGSTTSAYTTTGFYMKAKGQTDRDIKVHLKRDTKYSGRTGANMLGSLPFLKQVTVGVYDGANQYVEPSVANPFFSPWTTPWIGENIQISSNGGDDGQYFVQYLVVQGAVGTGTTSKPGGQTSNPGGQTSNPGHIETTTKSSGTIQFLVSLMISIGLVGFL